MEHKNNNINNNNNTHHLVDYRERWRRRVAMGDNKLDGYSSARVE